jgi:hypothetical protein
MSWESIWSYLGTFFLFLTKNETLAICVPFLVFVITLFLSVRKSIGFFVTVALLAFSLSAGLAIMNYRMVRDWIQNDIPEAHYVTLKQLVEEFKEEMVDSLGDIQLQLSELEEEKETFQQVAHGNSYLLQKIEAQESRIELLLQATEASLKSPAKEPKEDKKVSVLPE